jgi:phosphate-selective porin OprO/OprP
LRKNKLLLIFGLFFLVQASPAEEKTSSEPALKLNGYTQVGYTHWEDGASEFRIRRARLGLKGDIFKNINYRLQIDVTKSPILMDAIVEFSLSSHLGLRIGQFKVPFSLESLASSSSLDTINRSQPVEKVCPGRDIGSYGRDIGVMASGKFSKVECFLGIFNGSGINRGDLNKQKDIAARLVLHPLDFIQVAAAFYKGQYTSDAGEGPVRRDRSGIEVFLNRSRFSLKGEYIFAKDDQTSREGWYVQAGCFMLSKKLQSIIKYDSYDKDREMAGDRSDVMTIGLNLFFTENTKFQINYELHREESGSRSNSALLAQFQAGF